MKKRIEIVALLIFVLIPAFPLIGIGAPSLRVLDGIAASLEVEGNQGIVRWRFVRPQTPQIRSIEATLAGQPVGVPGVASYPSAFERTAILALIDISDPRREAQINQDKLSFFQLARRAGAHHQIAIAVYDSDPYLLTPAEGNVQTLITMVAGASPRDTPPRLNDVLLASIETLSRAPADRRGIFVFTDGHSDQGVDLAALIGEAQQKNVTISFLMSDSARQMDRKAIQSVAVMTGGQVVDLSYREAFLKQPFDLLDSGGTAVFPLDLKPRFFWKSDPELRVVFSYGTNELVLLAVPTVPIAGLSATAAHVVENHPIAVAASGGTFLTLLGGLVALGLRRRRAPSAVSETVLESARHPVLALLQNIGDGTNYPIQSPVAQIGRARSNDVVLNDETVSRLHAVLVQDGAGTFSIENRSELNGTQVNHQDVSKASLTSGDLITVGSTTLRFSQAPARGNSRTDVTPTTTSSDGKAASPDRKPSGDFSTADRSPADP